MTSIPTRLGIIDSKEGVLVLAVCVLMVWSDQQHIADIKANGTENWQVHKAELPRFSDFIYTQSWNGMDASHTQDFAGFRDPRCNIIPYCLWFKSTHCDNATDYAAASQDAAKDNMMLIMEERSLQMSPDTFEAWKRTPILKAFNFFSLTVIQHCSALWASLCFCAAIWNATSNNCNDQVEYQKISSFCFQFMNKHTVFVVRNILIYHFCFSPYYQFGFDGS